MTVRRQLGYCPRCRCKTIMNWQEPRHHLYSALTLSMIAAGSITPVSGLLLLALWTQRLVATCRWGCPHCQTQL